MVPSLRRGLFAPEWVSKYRLSRIQAGKPGSDLNLFFILQPSLFGGRSHFDLLPNSFPIQGEVGIYATGPGPLYIILTPELSVLWEAGLRFLPSHTLYRTPLMGTRRTRDPHIFQAKASIRLATAGSLSRKKK